MRYAKPSENFGVPFQGRGKKPGGLALEADGSFVRGFYTCQDDPAFTAHLIQWFKKSKGDRWDSHECFRAFELVNRCLDVLCLMKLPATFSGAKELLFDLGAFQATIDGFINRVSSYREKSFDRFVVSLLAKWAGDFFKVMDSQGRRLLADDVVSVISAKSKFFSCSDKCIANWRNRSPGGGVSLAKGGAAK
jgi:hypothetical protein